MNKWYWLLTVAVVVFLLLVWLGQWRKSQDCESVGATAVRGVFGLVCVNAVEVPK